jgi:NAD(P)-dependent dehydrogenase (short-subunit alcohol dehydrogenase family)
MRQDMKTLLGIGSVAALGDLAAKTAMRRARALDLTGKVVLITGGSRGLGLALTREFAKHGARIAVCARDEADLETVLAEFAGMGDNFLAVTCDVTDREQVDTMVMQIESLLGPIEVLVNSAGRIIAGPVENQGVESYEDAMNTNFWGPLYASYAVMDGMKGRRSGRIVNIASLGGKIAVPHLLPYSASKFALVGFSEGLRMELAKDDVRVTTVCPGLMRTGSPRNADFAGQSEKEYTWFTVSDSLPGVAVGSAAAARKIVDACIHGDAELILGATAKLATMLHAVMPDALNEILGFINTSLMPAPGRNGTRRKKGFESETAITQSGLTALTRVAEVANNQL